MRISSVRSGTIFERNINAIDAQKLRNLSCAVCCCNIVDKYFKVSDSRWNSKLTLTHLKVIFFVVSMSTIPNTRKVSVLSFCKDKKNMKKVKIEKNFIWLSAYQVKMNMKKFFFSFRLWEKCEKGEIFFWDFRSVGMSWSFTLRMCTGTFVWKFLIKKHFFFLFFSLELYNFHLSTRLTQLVHDVSPI